MEADFSKQREQRSQNISRVLPQKCETCFRNRFVVCDAEIPLIVSVVVEKKLLSRTAVTVSLNLKYRQLQEQW